MFAGLRPAVRRVSAFAGRLWRDPRAIESVEYAVVAAVVIVVCVRAYSALSYAGIGHFFNGLANGFTNLKINL